ncbi:MAG: hypothetical protein J0M16_04035 [Gammaproteobacteria bacterium]|nr:hypothetical protein [Gammaproteobacteria bacterium]
MNTRRQPIPADRERGAALLILLLILVLGGVALFSRNLLSVPAAATRAKANAELLAEAKEALLGYATTWDATHPGELGFLPCPDLDATGILAEGEAHELACGLQHRSALGRLPWRTLGIDPGRARGGECLWYAVSGSWKAATLAKPAMLNEDSAGQFRVLATDGTVIAGASPADRAVAVIIAPGRPLPGQVRATLPAGVTQCGGNFTASGYLDNEATLGINNANVSAGSDAIDDFVTADPGATTVNDQVIFITRAELQARLLRRADVQARLSALGQAIARCIADYGKRNPAGANDRRLPWPATVDLVDYRSPGQYTDTPVGELSGRVPDQANDSNASTGNTSAGVLSACNAATVPEWTPAMATLWRHWKDHFFYAVAADFKPDAIPVTTCTNCLRVNGAGAWAGIVIFAGSRLAALGQVRDEPPMDADTRGTIGNYLEGRNATNHPNIAGTGNYQSGAASPTFNDVLFCIDANLGVTAC